MPRHDLIEELARVASFLMRRDDRRRLDRNLLPMDSEQRRARDRHGCCGLAGHQDRFFATDSVAVFSCVARPRIRPQTRIYEWNGYGTALGCFNKSTGFLLSRLGPNFGPKLPNIGRYATIRDGLVFVRSANKI